jgi:hypothetical protein
LYDVLNEPDAFGVRFEPANGRPGMKDLYFLAFDAIYAVNPSAPALQPYVASITAAMHVLLKCS